MNEILTKPTEKQVYLLEIILESVKEYRSIIRENAQGDAIKMGITYKHARTDYVMPKSINIMFLPVGNSEDRFGYGDIYQWNYICEFWGRLTKDGYDFLNQYADEKGNVELTVLKALLKTK